MEAMYQQYKDIADFRLVYINEAHAADGRFPVGYAKEKGITEHDDYGERCTSAELLLKDEALTVPFLIDNMDNKVNKAYKAWPDRVFVVRSDGRLAVAAKRGPWGFGPAIKATSAWLAEYREAGREPSLPADAAPAGPDVNAQADKTQLSFDDVAGQWWVEIDLGGITATAIVEIIVADGEVAGTWTSTAGAQAMLSDITLTGNRLSFTHEGEGNANSSQFEGRFEDGKLAGTLTTPAGSIRCIATRER